MRKQIKLLMNPRKFIMFTEKSKLKIYVELYYVFRLIRKRLLTNKIQRSKAMRKFLEHEKPIGHFTSIEMSSADRSYSVISWGCICEGHISNSVITVPFKHLRKVLSMSRNSTFDKSASTVIVTITFFSVNSLSYYISVTFIWLQFSVPLLASQTLCRRFVWLTLILSLCFVFL